MILFSPAKINLGLQIIERRQDGFHNLRSVMIPVGLCDILELRRSETAIKGLRFTRSGIAIPQDGEKNLCLTAWELYSRQRNLPPMHLHLHKQIPVGAGLGGGSSNASTILRGLDRLSGDPLPEEKLFEMAAELGSDCPFFLHQGTMMMEGRGEILSPVALELDKVYLVLLYPELHISTAEAYAGIQPSAPGKDLLKLIREPMDQWNGTITNDFEKSLFEKHPELEQLKHDLYTAGATYASLSGSGSALYGFFTAIPDLNEELEKYVVWKGPAAKLAGIR